MAFYTYKNNLKEFVPYVLLVILIYTFSSLAMWQLDRAKEKKENPTTLFREYCEKEPWQVECKEYDV